MKHFILLNLILLLSLQVAFTSTTGAVIDDDVSGRIYEIETYQGQQSSPLEQQPLTKEIEAGIEDYGYSFWFKLDYLWKSDPKFSFDLIQHQQIELAYLSETKNTGWDTSNPGSRNLALSILHQATEAHLVGSTYNLASQESNKNNIEQTSVFPSRSQFDSEWTFVHFSYSKQNQKAFLGVRFADSTWKTQAWESISHNAINLQNKIYFRLANTRDVHTTPGWNGQYRWVRLSYGLNGQGGYRELQDIKAYFGSIEQPKVVPVAVNTNLTVRVTDNDTEVDNVTYVDQAFVSTISDVQYPKQYAVQGFFKVNADTVLETKQRLVYKVSTPNVALAGDVNNLGNVTLQAQVNNNSITFTTYSISDVSLIETVLTKTFTITQDDYQNDIYLYHAYSADAKQVVGYIKTYDSEGQYFSHESTNGIVHMRSNNYVVTLAEDQQHDGLPADFKCFKFQTGGNSFFNSIYDVEAQIDETCTQEGEKPPGDGIYSLQSYNYQDFYLSYGNPSFLTDDKVARFYIVAGLVGDSDTVSLKSAQQVDGQEKQDFYWRHSNGVMREMQSDGSEEFNKNASFIIHKDMFIEGTIALECADKRGFYVRHQNYIIKIATNDDTQLFKEDASWIFQQQDQPLPVTPALVPIYRMYNEDTGDTVLTVEDERVVTLKAEGYTELNQQFEDTTLEASNIIGYGYTINIDSHSAALIEYYNPTEDIHFYTTEPNNKPSADFYFNLIICYVYPMLYERTSAVYQSLRLEEPGIDFYHWTTSVFEKETLQGTEINYQKIGFYVVNSPDDPCLYDTSMCGPVIPTPCETEHHYRPTQDDECQECFGELTHYEGDVVDLKYTAICTPCEGGFDEDENGVRTCRECPNGQWVDTGLDDKVCYPNCSVANNQYLDINTLTCKDCSGELVPDVNLANVYTCKNCEMGTDIQITCNNGVLDQIVYSPASCPTDYTQTNQKQICKVCQYGNWTRNADDGILYCIKTCEDSTYTVNDSNQCVPCTGGFIYDDAQGTKRCAPHVTDGPFTYPDNEEDPFSYDVPGDQLDDISEYGFFVWVRHSYLNPKRFDFTTFQQSDARIGGFVTGYSSRTAAYSEGLIAHYPLYGNVLDIANDYNGVNNGAVAGENRFGNSGKSLYFNNNYLSLPSEVLNGHTDYTISFWFKKDQYFNQLQTVVSGSKNGDNQLLITKDYVHQDYNGAVQCSTSSVAQDTWSHYVVTSKNGQKYIYVDGVQFCQGLMNALPLEINQNGLIIGQDQDCLGGCFDVSQAFYGYLSDLRFYDYAMDGKTVSDLYKYELQNEIDENVGGGSGTDKSDGLEAYLASHSDSSQEFEQIAFEGQQQNLVKTPFPSRKDFDYSWNLIYMAQGSNGKATGYIHYTHSEQSVAVVFDSEIPSTINRLSFYLSRKINHTALTALGFQGNYYNVQLRFGQAGVYHNDVASIEAYLLAQNAPITIHPPVLVHTSINKLFEDDTEVKLSDLTKDEKTFRFTGLEGTEEYAVYGWFKHNSDSTLNSVNSMLFNLKDQANTNTDINWGLAQKTGDRALTCEYTSAQNLVFSTYSSSPTSTGMETKIEDAQSTTFDERSINNWFFVYKAYSRKSLNSWSFTQELLNGDVSVLETDNTEEFFHYRPDEQVLSLGYYPSTYLDDASQHSVFDGSVWNIRVQYGNLCKSSDIDCLESLMVNPPPAPFGQCVIVYENENYTGHYESICDENEAFNILPESIYVPEGVKFQLWDQPQFEGLTVTYTQSFPSLVTIDFQMLLQGKVNGASITKNSKYNQFIKEQQQQKSKASTQEKSQEIEQEQQQDKSLSPQEQQKIKEENQMKYQQQQFMAKPPQKQQNKEKQSKNSQQAKNSHLRSNTTKKRM